MIQFSVEMLTVLFNIFVFNVNSTFLPTIVYILICWIFFVVVVENGYCVRIVFREVWGINIRNFSKSLTFLPSVNKLKISINRSKYYFIAFGANMPSKPGLSMRYRTDYRQTISFCQSKAFRNNIFASCPWIPMKQQYFLLASSYFLSRLRRSLASSFSSYSCFFSSVSFSCLSRSASIMPVTAFVNVGLSLCFAGSLSRKF